MRLVPQHPLRLRNKYLECRVRGRGDAMERHTDRHSATRRRTYIGSIERGEQNISLANIEKIARALGVSIRDLFS
jgi:transcriptional regulator with XRE-family HTH domain